MSPFLKGPSHSPPDGLQRAWRSMYFRSYFKNRHNADAALSFATNAVLFSMCRVPVTCWLVCSCLKRQMEETACRRRSPTPQPCSPTTSQPVANQGELRRRRDPQEQLKPRLCSLAAEGMWKRQWVFGETDLAWPELDERDVRGVSRK